MAKKQLDEAAIAAKKEKEAIRKAAWYADNVKEIKVKQAEYRKADPEKENARKTAYRAAKKLEREATKVKTDD